MPSTSSPSLSSKMQRIFHWLPKPWKQTAILVAFFVFLLLTVNLISNTKKFQREKTIEELQQMVSITRIDTSKPSTEIDQEKVYKKTNMVDEASSELLKLQSKKLILFYTTLWGRERWKGFETTSNFNNWGGHPCKVQNCEITHDRDAAPRADVILFHAFASDMVSQQELKLLSKTRSVNQIWIYFVHATPYYAVPNPVFFNRYFNWTMTYQHNSDIVVPYNWESGTWQKKATTKEASKSVNYAANKDKLMSASINFCGLLRDKFIKRLQEYIDVDVYGSCSSTFHKKRKECPANKPECETKMKRYKFFLATEDAFCKDFITSTYYQTLIDGHSVPVVLGGADYKKWAIPNSYIDALEFETIEDLANHLKYLDQNDEVYNRYQKWREDYVLGPARSWSCEICRKINEEKIERKTYDKLGDWYSIEENCGTRVDTFKGLLKRSNVTGPYRDRHIPG